MGTENFRNGNILILLIGILFLSVNATLKAQESKSFGSFEAPYYDSYILDVISLGDSYLMSYISYDMFSSEGEQFNSLLLTDFGLNVKHELSNDRNENVWFLEYNKGGNYVIALGNRKELQENKLMVLKINIEDYSINYTDSISYPKGQTFGSYPNAEMILDSTYVVFGAFGDVVDYAREDIFIKLSKSGKVVDYGLLNLGDSKMISSAVYLKDYERYIVSTYFGDFLVLDDEYNVIKRVDKQFEYKRDGMKVVAIAACMYCYEQEEKSINCLARTPSGNIDGLISLELPLVEGEIESPENVQFLMDVEIEDRDRVQAVYVDRTSEDEFVFAASGSINPFNQEAEPNLIYISKLDKDFDQEWIITFDRNYEFYIRNMKVVEDDNILIVGEYASEEYLDRYQNFYLKLGPDGTIITSTKNISKNIFVVYPNPTSGPVNVKAEPGDYAEYVVYDMQGRLLKKDKMNGSMDFDISDFHAGTYFIHFMDSVGKVIGNSKVVKY